MLECRGKGFQGLVPLLLPEQNLSSELVRPTGVFLVLCLVYRRFQLLKSQIRVVSAVKNVERARRHEPTVRQRVRIAASAASCEVEGVGVLKCVDKDGLHLSFSEREDPPGIELTARCLAEQVAHRRVARKIGAQREGVDETAHHPLDLEPIAIRDRDTDGNILTNIRKAQMEQLGVKPGEFITFEVEGKTMTLRYVEDIHTGFKGAQLGDCMAIYYQAPLLSLLLFGDGSLSDVFKFEKGQTIKVWATAQD